MSLHAILEVIRSSGEAKTREIEKRAYAQAREILVNARLEADAIKAQVCAATLEPGIGERARILHRARLEGLQILGNVREGLVDSAFKQTHERLAGLRSQPTYPDVLRRLLVEALSELQSSQYEDKKSANGPACCLEADARDRAILENLLDELNLEFPVEYRLECWGGLIAKSFDDRVVVINTLEARLERAASYLRFTLASLFEDAQPEIREEEALA
jgi:V/A-type H+-transporting ATPase subunit E